MIKKKILSVCSDTDVMCAHHWGQTIAPLEPVTYSCFSLTSKLFRAPPHLFFLLLTPHPHPACLPMMLTVHHLLTGGGCSRQMLKCLVWSGFTRRRATRDSPMNSLCVSLSSSHTDTLGLEERKREASEGGLNWRAGRNKA